MDLICVATAANVAYRLFDSVRLRKIEIWASAAAAGTTLISIEDLPTVGAGQMSGKSQMIQDTVVGSAKAAHVVYRPTKGTFQDLWFSTTGGTQALVNVIVPASSVLDLTIEYTMADGNQAPSGTASVVAGAVTGQVYCRAFGVATSATNWVPIGLATI